MRSAARHVGAVTQKRRPAPGLSGRRDGHRKPSDELLLAFGDLLSSVADAARRRPGEVLGPEELPCLQLGDGSTGRDGVSTDGRQQRQWFQRPVDSAEVPVRDSVVDNELLARVYSRCRRPPRWPGAAPAGRPLPAAGAAPPAGRWCGSRSRRRGCGSSRCGRRAGGRPGGRRRRPAAGPPWRCRPASRTRTGARGRGCRR